MLRIHSYESMGTVDGPGLRFVIFLQGCNFRCLYCANPDTIDLKAGRLVSEDELYNMVADQKPYFGRRGGVTFSGGEPLLQAKALIPLVERFKNFGIHTCIDSNGGVWNDDVEKLLSIVDLVLLDVKQIDSEKHKNLTSRANTLTLRTAEWLASHDRPFWLRYVLVPGISTSTEDIETWGRLLGGYSSIQRVEILPYHRLGMHKYESLGWEYKLRDTPECTPEQISATESIFAKYFDCDIVCQ